MSTRIRSTTPDVSGGGGGPGTGGTVSWGPDFGEPNGADGTTIAIPRPAADLQNVDLSGNFNVVDTLAMPSLSANYQTTIPAVASVAGSVLGAPFVLGVTNFESTSEDSTLTLAVPAGTEAGDLLLFIGASAVTGTWTEPSGFTNIFHRQFTGVSTIVLHASWKLSVGTDPADYTWTIPSSACAGTLFRVGGVDTTTPIDIFAHTGASVADPVAPAVTTTVVNTMKFAAAAQNATLDGTFSPPGGYLERSDINGLGLLGVHIVDFTTATRAQANAISSGTATFDSTSIIAVASAACQIAVRPGPLAL